MKLNFDKKKRLIIISIAIFIALIPVVITAFELVTTGKDSVVFLGDYQTSIRVIALLYYAVLIILSLFWFTKQILEFIKIKNEKSKAELLHLKSQVNPHFFFNMLNNLYGLVDKDSKKAQVLILKLSDMMRYSIYDGERDRVLLSEEITYLENYIELHKMRYHKTIDIQFIIDINDTDYEIMPLLFIILLENAFKHGVENLRENAYVHIHLTAYNNEVTFEIENNFDEAPDNPETGIGLKNLKRRLELVYPKKHTLNLSKTDTIYNAKLNIRDL